MTDVLTVKIEKFEEVELQRFSRFRLLGIYYGLNM